jgi:hypothetical protein
MRLKIAAISTAENREPDPCHAPPSSWTARQVAESENGGHEGDASDEEQHMRQPLSEAQLLVCYECQSEVTRCEKERTSDGAETRDLVQRQKVSGYRSES